MLLHCYATHRRTVARQSSIGGLYVCVGRLDILKFDKNSSDLKCFIFQFGGLGALFGGLSPPKLPVATGLGHRRNIFLQRALDENFLHMTLRKHFRKCFHCFQIFIFK